MLPRIVSSVALIISTDRSTVSTCGVSHYAKTLIMIQLFFVSVCVCVEVSEIASVCLSMIHDVPLQSLD
jgi:hypothetical protein